MSSDDLAVLQLQLAGGSLVTVLINADMSGFTQEVVVCGTEGHLVAQGGDLRGKKHRETREEVLYIDVEDLNTTESFPSFLPRLGNILLRTCWSIIDIINRNILLHYRKEEKTHRYYLVKR